MLEIFKITFLTNSSISVLSACNKIVDPFKGKCCPPTILIP